MSTNTISISITDVITRIANSHLATEKKTERFAEAYQNKDKAEVLQSIKDYCDQFDSDWAYYKQKREAMSFSVENDNWEAPAPDMQADEKKKEEIAMKKEIYSGKEETAQIMPAWKEGTVGEHTGTIIGIKGNGGWKQLRIVDENRALYEVGVWTLAKVDPQFNFTNDKGEQDNACERSRVSKVVCKIIGHGPDGDIYSDCYNHFDDLAGSPATIIGNLIAKSVQIKFQAVPNERWDGRKPSKRFKVLFAQQKLSDACVDEFGGFVDDFASLPTGDEPEQVQYNDAIDSRVKKNFAPRPTEDAVC